MRRRLPLIKSVMTPFPWSVDIDTPLTDARDYMQKYNIHHLPVTDGGRLMGILNEYDLRDEDKTRVGDFDLRAPCVHDLNARLDDVLRAMAEGHVHTVLVTRRGKLVGVFTVTDACRCFADYLKGEFGPPDGDEAA